MTADRLYSTASSGLLLGMTALQVANGAEPAAAFRSAVALWEERLAERQRDVLELAELEELVTRLTRG